MSNIFSKLISLTSNVVGVLPIANGGTNASTKATAFDSLSPMTTLGDLVRGGASGTGTRLVIGNTSALLSVAAGIPAWQDQSWQAHTPTVKYGATTATATTNYSRFVQIGKTVIWKFCVTVTNLNAGTGLLTLGLPLTAESTIANAQYADGSMTMFNNADSKYYVGTIRFSDTMTIRFFTTRSGNGTTADMSDVSNTNFPVSSRIDGTVNYELP